MGFNKKQLPSISTLQQMVKDLGTEYVVRMYTRKVDALTGSTESLEYLRKIAEQYDSNLRKQF
jgi:predicted RNA-binding protein (virulence factor B family)